MSLRARVGRHTREGGRQCQNWADDQQTTTNLLNHIAVDNGGAAGNLKAPIRQGLCGDALYAAILQFEARHFQGQRNGFVDPGGALLKRLEDLAAPAAETRLDILRGNVLNMPKVLTRTWLKGTWKAGDLVELDKLVRMAVDHIDKLKSIKDDTGKPLEALPWYGEVVGRASMAFGDNFYEYANKGEVVIINSTGRRQVVVPQMQFASPLVRDSTVVTSWLPALLLFNEGLCFPLVSFNHISSAFARQEAVGLW
jgi:hypothetical protein